VPSISVAVSPSVLWPPNHKLVPVALNIATSDNCGSASSSCTVTSSEGSVEGDYAWVDGQLQLRAGRDPSDHTGRVYTITCIATDGSGNTQSASTQVVVPQHDWTTCGENHTL
jgi:hypothetical protein